MVVVITGLPCVDDPVNPHIPENRMWNEIRVGGKRKSAVMSPSSIVTHWITKLPCTLSGNTKQRQHAESAVTGLWCNHG